MNHDLLGHLADVETGSGTPALATIERRARAILRGRRTARMGAIGLAVVATVALGTILPLGSQGGAPLAQSRSFPLPFGAQPAAAGSSDADCNIGFGSQVERADWASIAGVVESASLIAESSIPLTHVEVHLSEMNCPAAVPAAVLYDADPVRGISVWPDIQDPFVGLEDPPDNEVLDRVVVDGHEALLRDSGNQSLQLTWLAADGTRWMALSSGFATEDALTVLNTLSFSGLVLDPSSVPADLTVAPVSAVPPSTTERTWQAWYGEKDDQPAADAPVTVLSAKTVFTAPVEVNASMHSAGTLFVTVNGHSAAFVTNEESLDFMTSGGLRWVEWTREGVSYKLVGVGTIDELVALAEKVEHVSLDDGRVTGAPGPEDAPGR